MRLLLALIVVGALVSTLYAEHQHSAQHQHGQTPASQTPTSQAPVSEEPGTPAGDDAGAARDGRSAARLEVLAALRR